MSSQLVLDVEGSTALSLGKSAVCFSFFISGAEILDGIVDRAFEFS